MSTYDLAIKSYSGYRLDSLHYTLVPIVTAINIPKFNLIKIDPPEAVQIPKKLLVPTSYYTNTLVSLSQLFQTLALGSSFNRFVIADYAWRLKQMSEDLAFVDSESNITVYGKKPQNKSNTPAMKALAKGISEILVSSVNAPLTYQHGARSAFNLISALGYKDQGVEISFNDVSMGDSVIGVTEGDVLQWVIKSNLWNFATSTELGISMLNRVKYLFAIGAIAYGAKKPSDPFRKVAKSCTYVLPSSGNAYADQHGYKGYVNLTYEPWMPVAYFNILGLMLQSGS